MTDRRAELATALAGVRSRIADACAAAGRSPEEVRLLAVTKTFPASDVALLSDLGLTDFGENRDQEAAKKVAELRELRPDAVVRWHMVGRVQRNKARSVARWSDEVQSVDSPRLVEALAKAAQQAVGAGERSGDLDVLVQVSLDQVSGRGGCPPAELPALASAVARSGGLRLCGVMAIAPLGVAPSTAFTRLAEIAAAVCREHPEAAALSAGMSGDLEDAVANGSSCVRVGTALLGARPLPFR